MKTSQRKIAGTIVAALFISLFALVPTMAAQTEVHWITWGSSTSSYEPVFAAFEKKYPDIKIVVEQGPGFGAYINKLQVMQAAGVAPDVMRLSGAFVGSLGQAGMLEALDPYIQRDGVDLKNDFLPMGDAMKFDGKLYGLGQKYDIVGMVYNKDMFANSAIGRPNDWTWNDLRNAAKKLTVREDNKVERYGFQLYAESGYNGYASWMNFFAQNGVKILSSDKRKAAFNTPAGVEVVRWMYDFNQDGTATPALTSENFDFAAQQVAITFDIMPNSFKSLRQGALFDWDVAPLPKGKYAATTSNTTGFGVSSSSKVKEAAWKLVHFMATEGNMIMAENKTTFPTYKPALPLYADDPTLKPVSFMSTLSAIAPGAGDLWFTPSWSNWVSTLGTRISEAVSGAESPSNALETAEKEVNVLLADEYK